MRTRRLTAGVPAYTGPEGPCPRCGLPGAMTEWHWAAPHAAGDMAGRLPPCAGHEELAVPGGAGEHLCRVCLNCGYGWPEACVRQADAGPVPMSLSPSPAAVLVTSLACALLCTAAGDLLAQRTAGAALAAAWLAVDAAVAVAVTVTVMVTAARAVRHADASGAGHDTKEHPQ